MSNRVSVEIDASVQGFVQGMDQATESVQKYETETRRVQDSTVNLNKELKNAKREVQNLAAGYSKLSDEEKNSSFGREMARQLQEAKEKAAEYIDLQGDLNTELKNMASDTAVFDTLSDGLTALGSTVSAVTGTMGIFTDDTQLMTKAVTMFTTAESLASAAIKVKNLLQRQSSLLLGIGRIQQMAEAAAVNLDTAAKGKNAIATTAATVAQKAFNAVAKANPYVLLATGIAAVGTALWGFISSTDDASEEQEELNKKMEEAKEKAEAYKKELDDIYVNTAAKLLSSFTKLQTKWKELNTEAQKKEFIKEYAQELNNLGVAINSVNDAENLFINNAENFVRSITLRARAAVLQRQLEHLIEEQIRAEQEQAAFEAQNPNAAPNGQYNIYGAIAQNTAREIAAVEAEIESLLRQFRSSVSDTNNTTRQTADSIQYLEGSLADLEAQLSKLQNDQKKGFINLSAEEYQKQVKNLEEQIKAKKISLGILVEAKVDTNSFDKIQEIMNNAIHPKIELSATYDFSKLPEEFSKAADEAIDSMKRIEEAKNKLEEIKSNSDVTSEDYANASDAIEQLNSEYDRLREQANIYQELSDESKKLEESNERTAQSLELVGNALKDVGSIMSSIYTLSEDKTFNTTAIIAQAIANYVLGWSEATKKASKLGAIGWAAFGLSTLTQVMATIAQIKQASRFAEGGIVGGSSYNGDKVMARVNSGEMILNKRQQRNLFNLLDGNTLNGKNPVTIDGEVRVKGSDLYISMKNYTKGQKLVGKNTGII